MSPLEVYHHDGRDWRRINIINPGNSGRLEPDDTRKRFLLECAGDDSHSVASEVPGSVVLGGLLINLSQQPESERLVINQGQTCTLTLSRGTHRESAYRLKQVPRIVPNWQRTRTRRSR